MQKKYGARGFSVISVSSDESPAQAGAFAKEIKATFPVVHDKNSAVFEKFGVEPLPTNIVIDRKGRVVYSKGEVDLKGLEAAVQRAVAAK
jgi:peroxiredoxin